MEHIIPTQAVHPQYRQQRAPAERQARKKAIVFPAFAASRPRSRLQLRQRQPWSRGYPTATQPHCCVSPHPGPVYARKLSAPTLSASTWTHIEADGGKQLSTRAPTRAVLYAHTHLHRQRPPQCRHAPRARTITVPCTLHMGLQVGLGALPLPASPGCRPLTCPAPCPAPLPLALLYFLTRGRCATLLLRRPPLDFVAPCCDPTLKHINPQPVHLTRRWCEALLLRPASDAEPTAPMAVATGASSDCSSDGESGFCKRGDRRGEEQRADGRVQRTCEADVAGGNLRGESTAWRSWGRKTCRWWRAGKLIVPLHDPAMHPAAPSTEESGHESLHAPPRQN